MKRLLSFLGILALMGIVLFIGYYFRYQAGGPAGPETSDGESPLELPDADTVGVEGGNGGFGTAAVKFGPLSDDQVSGYSIAADGSAVLVRTDGQIVRVNGKSREVLSGTTLEGVIGAWFSMDGLKVVVGYGGVRAPQYSLLDIPAKSWRQLDGIDLPAWSPVDGRMAYVSKLGGLRRLTVLDMTDPKAKPETLGDLPIEDATLSWPSPDRILVGERSSSRYPGSAWLYDLKTRAFTRIMTERLGGQAVWSFGGGRGIEFRSNQDQRGGVLFMLDASGREVKQFDLLTLPEKCSFLHSFVSSTASGTQPSGTSTTSTRLRAAAPPKLVESLWCAVPRDQASLARRTLPDEYSMGAFATEDDIYAIDPETGSIVVPAASPAAFDATHVSVIGNKIYFVNRTDGRTYFLEIPKQNPSS